MKGNGFKFIDENVIDVIPQRKVLKTDSFCGSSSLKEVVSADSSDYSELTETVIEANGFYAKNQSEQSRFCYISHQKKDGVISAKTLDKAIKENGNSTVVYNPRVEEKSIASYIKFSQLKNKALEYDYIEKNKIPLINTVLAAIPGVLLVLDCLIKIFELTNFTKDNSVIGIFEKLNFGIIFTVVLAVLFAVSMASIIFQYMKNKKNIVSRLNRALLELDDDEFCEFLEEFSGDDFLMPDCNTENSVYICVLQNYSPKEKYILKAYWSKASKNELWWIFAEATNENFVFVLDDSCEYQKRFYYMKPLSKREKKRIAEITYKGNEKNITPLDDGGIKIFGIDYLCRFCYKDKDPIGDTKALDEKIEKFRNSKSSYQVDIERMIRIVADLSCTYGFDFENKQKWQYLFDYNQGDAQLNELDKRTTEALCFDNRVFKNLIPEIVHIFSENFEEIVEDYPNRDQTTEYEQWCIIKALKSRTADNEDSYFAICDTLMMEFSNYKDEKYDIADSKVWRDVLLKTIEVFYNNQFFWFLPTLVHNLIYFFGNQKQIKERLFSQTAVMNAARANFLLSINAESNNYSYARIDLVRDHYTLVCAAARELNNDINLDANSTVPPSFELLQFTPEERRRYYNALHFLKENVVIDYLNYMFDMFCAVVSTRRKDAQFCYNVIYENSLYDKYIKKTNINNPTEEDYIKIISSEILELIYENFGEELDRIRNSINELSQCLKKEDSVEDIIDNILLLIVEFEVSGFNTLNFIACLLGRVNKSKKLSQDTYLNLGNYLLGVVFLTYHEISMESFYNEDFKYLVDIFNNYKTPGGAILGFLCSCNVTSMPHTSAERINKYILRNKEKYLKKFIAIASRIDYKDIEHFLSFFSCVKFITKEEKVEVYTTLKKHVEKDYSSHPISFIYLEYFSLILENKSTPQFENELAENNITTIIQSEMLFDMTYLLYKKYIECYKEKYIGLYHQVAPVILKTDFNLKTDFLIECLFDFENSMNEVNFSKTAKLIYERLSNKYIGTDVTVIGDYIRFLKMILDCIENYPELYWWATKEDTEKLLDKMVVRIVEINEIQAKEFCALRTWNNYGIAIYLRELLKIADALYCPEDYKNLKKEEKSEYIVNNFKKLKHYVVVDEKRYINKPYFDMVTFFINNYGDIQHRLNEVECMNKLTQGLIDLVKNNIALSEEIKKRVCGLVSEFMKNNG